MDIWTTEAEGAARFVKRFCRDPSIGLHTEATRMGPQLSKYGLQRGSLSMGRFMGYGSLSHSTEVSNSSISITIWDWYKRCCGLRAHHGPAPQPCCDVLDAAAAEEADDAGLAKQPAGGGRDGRGGRAAAGRVRPARPREGDARR
eukprot:4006064-Prymnesium_polylepis.1